MNDDLAARLQLASEAARKLSVLLQEASMEIKLLATKVNSLQKSLEDRMRVALDAQRQNEWFRERLRECPAPSSLSPD